MRRVTGGPEALTARYLAGRTLRQLGEEIGRSHTAVRYQLRKVPGYRRMVTGILRSRVKATTAAYSVTRTPENRRRMKHALAMLRQKRPAVFARWIAKQAPPLPGAKRIGQEYRADCPSCSATRAVWARKRGRQWHWRCYVCEATGAV